MAYEQKDMEGSLWANDRRREGKQDPQAKGSAVINGVAYWVSAWTNTTDDGRKWQKLKFEPKEDSRTPSEAPPPVDDLDDLPF